MNKLFRITGISKNDAYHNDKFLIGEIGTLENSWVTEKGYICGKFTKFYRNAKDTEKWHDHTFFAIRVAEVIPESEVTKK